MVNNPLFDDTNKLKGLITRVSQHTDIRRDVTEMVVRGLIDVLASDIANDGAARLPYIMTVRNYDHSGNADSLPGVVRPSKRLAVKISAGIRGLYLRKQREPELEIDENNWRSYIYDKDKSAQDRSDDEELSAPVQVDATVGHSQAECPSAPPRREEVTAERVTPVITPKVVKRGGILDAFDDD